MARAANSPSIDDILRDAMEPVLKRVSAGIARKIARIAAQRIDRDARAQATRGGRRARSARAAAPARRPGRRREEITRWVADRRARRVPNFVIEMTNGLDTKKKIVARFGPDAVFEKGKPLPKPK